MDVLGIESANMQQQVLLAVCGVGVLFFVLSPLAGRYIHRFSRRLLPEQDLFALLAAAFVVFALTSAVMFGLLRRLTPAIDILQALGVSLTVAALVTGVTAAFIHYTVKRGTDHPHTDEFGVWGEDARKRTKNLRKKR